MRRSLLIAYLIFALCIFGAWQQQSGVPMMGSTGPPSGSGTPSPTGTPCVNAGAAPITCVLTIQNASDSVVYCAGNAAGDSNTAPTNTPNAMTWTAISSSVTGNGWTQQCWRGLTATTGSTTITCNDQFGDAMRCFAAEFTPEDTGIDTNNTGTGASGTAMASASFTTVATDTLIGFGCSSSGVTTAGSGYTGLITSDARCYLEYQKNVAAGTQTASMTAGGSNPWLIQGFGLK